MKEGLIRLTGEKDIFYDSAGKVYRYRMHCLNCDMVSTNCRCYHDLDDLLSDIDAGLANYTCSSICALLYGHFDEITDAMEECGHSRDNTIDSLTEDQALRVLSLLVAGEDFDCPGGKNCEV